MASPKFSVFLTQLAASLREEKGPELAYLLKPTSEHGRALVKDFRGNITVRLTPNTHHILVVHPSLSQRQSLSHYEGSLESPWDEIAIQYVLVVNHCGKKRATEAFKEECTLLS